MDRQSALRDNDTGDSSCGSGTDLTAFYYVATPDELFMMQRVADDNAREANFDFHIDSSTPEGTRRYILGVHGLESELFDKETGELLGRPSAVANEVVEARIRWSMLASPHLVTISPVTTGIPCDVFSTSVFIAVPSPTPTAIPTPTAVPPPTAMPTPVPTPTPIATATPVPTATLDLTPTPAPTPTATTMSAAAALTITLVLADLNGSGQSGTATLIPLGDQIQVVLDLSSGGKRSELVHIHSGQCGDKLRGVNYLLNSFVGGSGLSTTTVETSLDEVQDGDHAIHVHQGGNPAVYTACGNIPR